MIHVDHAIDLADVKAVRRHRRQAACQPHQIGPVIFAEVGPLEIVDPAWRRILAEIGQLALKLVARVPGSAVEPQPDRAIDVSGGVFGEMMTGKFAVEDFVGNIVAEHRPCADGQVGVVDSDFHWA